ncbi:hypothetical protein ACFL04_04650, partial [Patescibacteria group bacterium]
EAPGTTVTLNQGAYSVDENLLSGYTPVYSTDCTGTISVGESKTCLVTNNDQAAHLIVIKHVVNDDGGTKVASDFSMQINGVTVPSGDTFAGEEAPGTDKKVHPGAYNVTETQLAGYADTYSADCSGTIALGETKICTVTNNDIAPELTVIKHVINDDGGTAVAADFTMNVTGTNVSNASFPGAEAPGTTVTLNQGAYSVDEDFYFGYAKTLGNDCSGTINVGETKTCTITNDDIAPELTVIKHVINDDGGISVAANFTMNVTATNVLPQASFPGNEAGTTVTLNQGAYSVDENPYSGYAKTIGNDCSGTINVGETKTCTITNDDRIPEIVKTGPDTVVAGNNITYTLNWSVSNDTFYNKLVITDPIPAGTIFVSASSPGTENAGVVTWDLGPVGPSDSGFVTVTVNVPAPEYNGTIIENSAEVCGLSIGVTLLQSTESTLIPVVEHCDDDDHTTTVISEFDVEIDKDGPLVGEAGEEITYSVDWSTSGNSPIDSLIITDTLPADTVFVSASDGGVEAGGVITWDLGAQSPGVSGSFTVTVTLAADLLQGDTVTNESEICAEVFESVVQEGLLLICDDDDTTTTIVKPILEIEKTVVGDAIFYNPGDTVTYSVVVTNVGDATAKNVVMIDTLPAGFTHATDDSTVLTFNLGDMIPAESITTTFDVLIDQDQSADFYDNTATADADNTDPVFDTATVEVRIPQVLAPEPILEIEKTVDKSFVNPGDTIVYTVKISNVGDGIAENVILVDTLPNGFTFVDTGTTTNTWTLGNIEPGSFTTVDYEVKVGDEVLAGFYDNLAVASADNHGPVTATTPVEVRSIQVLADTGIGGKDYMMLLLGAALMVYGFGLVRRREEIAI